MRNAWTNMGTDGNASKQPGMNGYFSDPNKKNPKRTVAVNQFVSEEKK